MKIWKPLALGIVLLAVATVTFVPMMRTARSVTPLPPPGEPTTSTAFDREQSAALFVGIRHFKNDRIVDIPYAVDDAIDLAYMFALERRSRLVPPQRVVLALSGSPAKKESRDRLHKLVEAGAQVQTADHGHILTLLERQTTLAGKNGILILSLATHGFTHDGVPYILGATSRLGQPETTLSTAKMLDVVAASGVRRSLVFVDACRERIKGATRAVRSHTTGAAQSLRGMPHVHGQIVLYAGQYAYDDPVSRNGVFTKAVIDGLNCNATAPRGAVTAETLAAYVERTVLRWIREHHDRSVRSAIQVVMDGEAKNMPLSQCWPPPGKIAKVSTNGSTVTTFSPDSKRLWQRDVGDRIAHAEVADLDADGQQVVVGTNNVMIAFDEDGRNVWSAHDGQTLRTFRTGDLFRKHTRQVVALWGGEGSPASRLSIYAGDGHVLSTREYPGNLRHVAIDRPTSRHAPRIVVATSHSVFLLDPKKISSGKPIWSGNIFPSSQTIEHLEIIDFNHDGKRDIAISMTSGVILFLDFKGTVIGRRTTHASAIDAQLRLTPRRARHSSR